MKLIHDSVRNVIKQIIGEDVSNKEQAEKAVTKFLEGKGIPIFGKYTVSELLNISIAFVPEKKHLLLNDLFVREVQELNEGKLPDALDKALKETQEFEQKMTKMQPIIKRMRPGGASISLTKDSRVPKSTLDGHFEPLFKILDKIEDITHQYDKCGITIKYFNKIIVKYYRPSLSKQDGEIYGIVRFNKFHTTNLLHHHVPERFWKHEDLVTDIINFDNGCQYCAQIKFLNLPQFCAMFEYFSDREKMLVLYDPAKYGRQF